LSASSLGASSLVPLDELRAATYIVRRTALQIWQVFDYITISTNTHPIRTLTWAVSTSWADATNGPLARVNICGIVTYHTENRYRITNITIHSIYYRIMSLQKTKLSTLESIAAERHHNNTGNRLGTIAHLEHHIEVP
jgi:hypothetical protein